MTALFGIILGFSTTVNLLHALCSSFTAIRDVDEKLLALDLITRFDRHSPDDSGTRVAMHGDSNTYLDRAGLPLPIYGILVHATPPLRSNPEVGRPASTTETLRPGRPEISDDQRSGR
jgi:hypothetical protein